MPQYLTLSIGAKVDKGPDIKSEAKFEISNYAPLIDELICKCTMTTTPFDLPAFRPDGLQVLITSDKYYSEKDCVPTPTQGRPCEAKKTLSYQFTNGAVVPDAWIPLQRPIILAPAQDEVVTGIAFKNDLTIDVKVSVLIFRLTPEPCAPVIVPPNGHQNGSQKPQQYQRQQEQRQPTPAQMP